MSKRFQSFVVVCLLSVSAAYAQVPDRLPEIKALWNGQHFNGEADRGKFTEKVVCALTPEFKHLKKFGGQNNYDGHAVDAVLHVATGYAVDIATDLQPIWLRDDEPIYNDPKFVMEAINCAANPTPTPSPEPTPTPVPPVDLEPLKKEIADLRNLITALIAGVREEITAQEIKIRELEARPLPPTACKASVFGFGVRCELVK